jgi:hypothetical protein
VKNKCSILFTADHWEHGSENDQQFVMSIDGNDRDIENIGTLTNINIERLVDPDHLNYLRRMYNIQHAKFRGASFDHKLHRLIYLFVYENKLKKFHWCPQFISRV